MRNLLLIWVCLLLSACGGSDGGPEEADREDRETVLDPMTETMDRAKAVEEIGQERKKAMDEALKEAEGGTKE